MSPRPEPLPARRGGSVSTQRPYAEVLPDGTVAVHAVKVDYVLTPGEIVAVLPCCPSLWRVSIVRGKAHKRAAAVARREAVRGQVIP